MHHENLWAPWRMAYLRELEQQADRLRAGEDPGATPSATPGATPEAATSGGSFLSQYWAHPERDAEQHVLVRDADGMILLNRFPYANGHLLVALGDPRPSILDYEPAQRAALWALVERAVDLVQRTLAPQGVNVGVNQGEAAGAGVPDHLHVHVVPRWMADTNFMSVIGGVRVVPDALESVAAAYRATLAG